MDEPAKAAIPAVLFNDELEEAGEVIRALLGKEQHEKVSPADLERAFRVCSGSLAMLASATGQDAQKVGEFVASIMAGIHVERRSDLGVAQEIARA